MLQKKAVMQRLSPTVLILLVAHMQRPRGNFIKLI